MTALREVLDAPSAREVCCDTWYWRDHDGRWCCGDCDPPEPGHRGPRALGAAAYAGLARLQSAFPDGGRRPATVAPGPRVHALVQDVGYPLEG